MKGYLIEVDNENLIYLDFREAFVMVAHYRLQVVGWLAEFYGISTFVGYLKPNPFYANIRFYFKQFSLTWVHSLIVEKIIFKPIQFIQTDLIQPIQFSINIDFVYTPLNIKIVFN